MTEVMLGEIARPPTNELLGCRESYALTAGISLGMIALGRGLDAAGLVDLHIQDKLGTYMHGQGSAQFTPNLHKTAAGAEQAARASSFATRCYRISEGPRANVDVTAAGAIIALGLIFAKSNNPSVASQLLVPRTAHALHCIRPDLILLRVLSLNLIMWDDIHPTQAWLQVKKHMHLLLKRINIDISMIHKYIYISYMYIYIYIIYVYIYICSRHIYTYSFIRNP